MKLNDLYKFKEKMINENYPQSDIETVDQLIEQKILEKQNLINEKLIREDSGTGGPAVSGASVQGGIGMAYANATIGGMGNVASSQPSAFPGSLNGQAWASGGGKEGSGDISVPYNPGGANRMFQKLPAKSLNHGSTRAKKSRKMDIKQLKNALSKKQDYTQGAEKKSKVMNFDDFAKQDMQKITKVKEGQAYKVAKGPKKDDSTIEIMRGKIKDHIKSIGCQSSRVGDDFVVSIGGKEIMEVMFRPQNVCVRVKGTKFSSEFKYNELGNIKKKISQFKKEHEEDN